MYEHGTLARPPRRADSGYRLVSWILAVLAALALAAFWRERHRAVAQPPGVLASAEPRQTALDGNVPPIQRGAFLITPAARFELQARVLSRADYHLGKESAGSINATGKHRPEADHRQASCRRVKPGPRGQV